MTPNNNCAILGSPLGVFVFRILIYYRRDWNRNDFWYFKAPNGFLKNISENISVVDWRIWNRDLFQTLTEVCTKFSRPFLSSEAVDFTWKLKFGASCWIQGSGNSRCFTCHIRSLPIANGSRSPLTLGWILIGELIPTHTKPFIERNLKNDRID